MKHSAMPQELRSIVAEMRSALSLYQTLGNERQQLPDDATMAKAKMKYLKQYMLQKSFALKRTLTSWEQQLK